VRVAVTGRTPPAGSGSANLSLLLGDGDVTGARRAALSLVGATPERAVFMEQVHGADVAVVTDADAGRGARDHTSAIPRVDALVTQARDLALVVLVADCVPVVLIDPGRAVGVVHAGRGGVDAGVVAQALARLTGDPSRVVALVGPAVGGCCYEVPVEMVDRTAAAWPGARATTSWGTPALDLPAAVTAQLRHGGVARVERIGACTRCDPQTYFSHRASSAGLAPAGRQAAIVLRAGPSTPAPATAEGFLQSRASS